MLSFTNSAYSDASCTNAVGQIELFFDTCVSKNYENEIVNQQAKSCGYNAATDTCPAGTPSSGSLLGCSPPFTSSNVAMMFELTHLPYLQGIGSVKECCSSDLACLGAYVPDSLDTCFAESETLTLSSGDSVSIADVTIGDIVLAFSPTNQSLIWSPVIAIPHKHNNVQAMFQHIVTESGYDIKLTADHLILAGSGPCDGSAAMSLLRAAEINVGSCVQTVDGQTTVTSNALVPGKGVYTVVTENADYIVVNGIVASPFAINHAAAATFYRILNALSPWVFQLPLFSDIVSQRSMFYNIVNKLTSLFSGFPSIW